MIKRIFLVLTVIAVLFFLVFLGKSIRKEKLYKETRLLMGTYCTIQAAGSGQSVMGAIGLAFDRMKEVEKKFNLRNPESPVYKFNNNNISLTDPEILYVCKAARSISEQTGGVFDITVYPLIKLWGFYGDTPSVPDKKEINECLQNIGYKKLYFKENKCIKDPAAGIDLGGIAKGYAVGEALKVLKKEGITSALIDAGGDIYALGRINGKPWRVGIKHPRDKGITGVVNASDISVVTSGDYERYFEENGRKYNHLLNPNTGYPAESLASVTVLSQNPMIADAWATALCIIGEKEGMKLVEKIKGLEALMITEDERIVYSSGFKDNLELTELKK